MGDVPNDYERVPSSETNTSASHITTSENSELKKTRAGGAGAQNTVDKMIDGDHPFQLTDTSADRANAAASAGGTDDKDKHRDWTVAVNLTTNLGDTICTIDYQMKELASIAEKTKDQPGVRLIVQGVFPKEGETGDAQRKGMSFSQGADRGEHYELRRFEVADGRVTPLETAQSHGIARDTQDLVSCASQYSAVHLALIQQEHGNGNQGILGDTGSDTSKALVDSIEKGLHESGSKFDKLDLLDFDSCLMAEKGVGDISQRVAKYMVASEETEGNVDDTAGGQRKLQILHDLIANPKMDGRELSQAIVADAQRGADIYQTPHGSDSGVQTLSAFDLSQADQYKQSLDKLATDLSAQLSDPNQRQQIETAIEKAKQFGTLGNPMGNQDNEKRDVHEFVNGLQKLIQKGSLKDSNGALQNDITAYLNAEHNYVISRYGQKDGYDTTGGVSAYIPSDNNLDVQARAEYHNLLQDITTELNQPHANEPGDEHKHLALLLEFKADQMRKQLQDLPQAQDHLAKLDESIHKFDQAQSEQDIQAAATKIKTVADAMKADSGIHDRLISQALPGQQRFLEIAHDTELGVESEAWRKFVDQLSATRQGNTATRQENTATRQDDTEVKQRDNASRQQNSQQDNSATKKADWTVAVDLTTNLRSDGDVTPGAHAKAEQLRQLRDSTKDGRVNFVVQEVDGKLLHRYEIKQGEITQLKDEDSHGYAKDTETLLNLAQDRDPSAHLGLINQSHGSGSDGVGANNSYNASLDELNASIRASLQSHGREKLDFLDFDSCDMGDQKVVNAFANTTESLVASSQYENTTSKADGQHVLQSLQILGKNPDLSGRELGDTFVRNEQDCQAKEHGNDSSADRNRDASIHTLSNYDTTKISQLNASMNTLGGLLVERCNDLKVREQLEEIRNSTFRYDKTSGATMTPNGDLKDFEDRLRQKLDSRTIPDPDGKIRQALNDVTLARKAVVPNFYGDSDANHYDAMGGIRVPLKDTTKYIPNQTDTLKQLINSHEMKFADSDRVKNLQLFRQIISTELKDQEARKEILADLDKMIDSKSAADFDSAAASVSEQIQSFERNGGFKRSMEAERQNRAKWNQHPNLQTRNDIQEWTRLIDSLTASAN